MEPTTLHVIRWTSTKTPLNNLRCLLRLTLLTLDRGSSATLQQSADNTRDDKAPKSKKAKRRAKQFKAQFPQVRDVPNALSDTDLNELCAKNGINPQEFDRQYGLVPS